MQLTEKDGKDIIALARKSISDCFKNRNSEASSELKKKFSEKQGVFVTLNKNGELRGCIGFPEPVLPLHKAVIEAAKSAAFSDPRFPILSENELSQITIELSVLTVPELIKVNTAKDYLKKITVGEDGLIIKSGFGSGLLLPQVAVEWGWNAEEFLMNTCRKACLNKDCWKDLSNRIYKFQAQIFKED